MKAAKKHNHLKSNSSPNLAAEVYILPYKDPQSLQWTAITVKI